MNKDILNDCLQLAKDAYRNISFSPEVRGESVIKEFSEELENDIKLINSYSKDESERYVTKYRDLFKKWLYAKGRCISTMITGPSNFPVNRAKKANRSEDNRYREFRAWRTKALNSIKKKNSEPDFIRMNESGTLQKLQEKLDSLLNSHEIMKSVNKIVRDKEGRKEERIIEAGLDKAITKEVLTPNFVGAIGFAPYALSNNNACIARVRHQIEVEKKNIQSRENGNVEYMIGPVKVLENVDDNRLQLFFNGKPHTVQLNSLKSNGFKWSPKNKAWQRQLTDNARHATKRLLVNFTQELAP